MKTTILHKTGILLTGLIMALTFNSCIKDDNEPCNHSISIVYDYNIDKIDKFSMQASSLNIFVFDSETGLFVQEIKPAGTTFTENYQIDIPKSLYGKEYDYIAWAGLDPNSFVYPRMQVGVSTEEDLKVQVIGYEEQLVDRELKPLLHGILKRVYFDEATQQLPTISLTKNTNKFRLAFSFINNGQVATPTELDNLEVGIYSCGWYGCDNTSLDDMSRFIRYAPYVSEKEENAGFLFELNTLRLMAHREINLVVKDKTKDKEVFRMPLGSYLNLLRMLEESWIDDFQEYLDREDDYKLLIFINNDGENWESFRIIINDWVVRDHTLTN